MAEEKLSPAKAYAQIASLFGEENVFLDPRDIPDVETLSTGSPSLDRALGVGGYPLGRIIQIAGTPSAGKTQITLIAAAMWQSLDPENCALFIDAEYTYDPNWAEKLGVDNDRMMLIKTNNAEKIFTGLVGFTVAGKNGAKDKHTSGLLDMIESKQVIEAKSGNGKTRSFNLGKMGVVIIDSVAAINTPTEEVSEVGKLNVAPMSRFLTTELKKLTPCVAKSNVVMFGINHVKTAIGVMYGDPTSTPGGRAWHHACSVQIMVATINNKDSRIIDENEEQIGHKVRAKITKNKCATPFKQAEYTIEYTKGIVNKEIEIYDAGILENMFERPNNRTYIYKGESFVGKDNFIAHIANNLEQFEYELRKLYLAKNSIQSTESPTESATAALPEISIAKNIDELF